MVKKIFKIIAWVVGSVLGLVLLVVALVAALLYVPAVQDFAVGKAVGWFNGKTGARAHVGRLNLFLPNTITLEDVFIDDSRHDTLAYIHKLNVDVDLPGLLGNKLHVREVKLDGLKARVKQFKPDSAFNFDYIAKAFGADSTKDAVKEPPKDTAKGMEMRLDRLQFTNLDLGYTSEVAGDTTALKLGYLAVEVRKMDLDSLAFEIGKIALNQTAGRYIINHRGQSVQTPDSVPLKMSLVLDQMDLDQVSFLFHDRVGNIYSNNVVGKHQMLGLNFVLHESKVDLRKVLLNDSKIVLRMGPEAQRDTLLVERVVRQVGKAREQAGVGSDTTDPNDIVKGLAWKVRVQQLTMANNFVSYDDMNAPRQPKGFDPGHMAYDQLGLAVRNVYVDAEKMQMRTDSLHFHEQSGFQLNNLQVQAQLTNKQARLDNLVLQTPHTRIERKMVMGYAGLDKIAQNLGALVLDLDLGDSYAGVEDLVLFAPDMAKQPIIARNRGQRIQLMGRITGRVNDLDLRETGVALRQDTRLIIDGNIKDVLNVQKAVFDLRLTDISTSQADLNAALPKGMIPATVRVPEKVSLTGTFRGRIDNFDTDTRLRTTRGDMDAFLHLQPHRTDLYTYNTRLSTRKLNLGYILKNKDLGPVDLRFRAKGSGFDTSNLHTDFMLEVDRFVYNNYAYRDIDLGGRIDQTSFTGNFDSGDSALDMHFKGHVDANPSKPVYDFELAVNRLWLHRLKLTDYPASLKLALDAHIEGNDPDKIVGDVALRNLRLRKLDNSVTVDSLVFSARHDNENHAYLVRSDVFDFTLEGNIIPSKLAETMMKHIDRYFPVSGTTKLNALRDMREGPLQHFELDLKMKRPEVIRETILPDLRTLEFEKFHGIFDMRTLAFNFEIDAPRIEYGSYGLYHLTLNTEGSVRGIKFNLGLDSLGDSATKVKNLLIASQVRLGAAEARMTVFEKPLTHNLRNVKDSSASDNPKRFALGVKFDHPDDKGYRMVLLDREFIVNNQPWNVAQDNFIRFSDPVYVHNVRLENNGANMLVRSKAEGSEQLEALFDHFGLGFLSEIIQEKEPIINGYLNGRFDLLAMKPAARFTTDLRIDSLAFRQSLLGTLAVKAGNPNPNRYDTDVRLTGQGNNVHVNGFYATGANVDPLNFNINLQPLSLKSVESLTFGQLLDAKGNLEGQLQVSGQAAAPTVRGRLTFREARFKSGYANSYFSLANESVEFTGNQIRFPNFTIRDTANRPATLTGYVATTDFRRMNLNLDFNTDKFQILNTTASNNSLYYGRMIIGTNLRIRGTESHPVITANVKLQEGSYVTYVIPRNEPATVNVEGMIEFKNYRHPIDTMELASPIEDSTDRTQFTTMDMRLNLELDPTTRFSVIIDQETGDNLVVTGGGVLALGLEPNGRMTLTGRYEINDGLYKLSVFNLVRREFRLKKGGYIVWNGSPMDANLNITAVYEVKASPIDLLSDMTAGLPDAEKNKYKQQLPFEVDLNMKGTMMKPEIDFGIEMPMSYRNAFGGAVDARLRQINAREDEVNKQVFALLVLNNFLPPSGNSTAPSTSLNAQARNSAGRLLANQVNALSDRLVKGVDLDFDLQSYDDYSTGGGKTRTDLNVGVKKQLFNDRVNVSVGSTVNVDGNQGTSGANNSGATRGQNAFVGNVIVEYSITEDGRYRFKAFRSGDTRSLAEGTIIETGVSILFTKDYDKLKYLFDPSGAEDPENLSKAELEKRFEIQHRRNKAARRKAYQRRQKKS